MTDAIAASVIRFVLQDAKTRRARGGDGLDGATDFLQSHGHLLASLAPEDLQLVQAASELVDRKAVKKVTALPSARVFFRVESLNRYHQTASHSATSQSFDASAMGGSGGPNYYNCFDHYCSCNAFHLTTVQTPSAMCKHIVAVLLADATDQCVPMTIQDLDFAKMLCPELAE